MIQRGEIPAAKIGRAWVMLTRDVVAYAEKLILDQTAERLIGRRPIRRGPRSL